MGVCGRPSARDGAQLSNWQDATPFALHGNVRLRNGRTRESAPPPGVSRRLSRRSDAQPGYPGPLPSGLHLDRLRIAGLRILGRFADGPAGPRSAEGVLPRGEAPGARQAESHPIPPPMRLFAGLEQQVLVIGAGGVPRNLGARPLGSRVRTTYVYNRSHDGSGKRAAELVIMSTVTHLPVMFTRSSRRSTFSPAVVM